MHYSIQFVWYDCRFRFRSLGWPLLSEPSWLSSRPCQQPHSPCLFNASILPSIMPPFAFKKVSARCIGGSGKRTSLYRISIPISAGREKCLHYVWENRPHPITEGWKRRPPSASTTFLCFTGLILTTKATTLCVDHLEMFCCGDFLNIPAWGDRCTNVSLRIYWWLGEPLTSNFISLNRTPKLQVEWKCQEGLLTVSSLASVVSKCGRRARLPRGCLLQHWWRFDGWDENFAKRSVEDGAGKERGAM